MTEETIKGEVVETNVANELLATQVSPEQLRAIQALRDAKIPPQHISSHPGKGGKIFKYVKHTVATNTMNDALGMNWDWEILETNLYPDKTATARGKLSINFQDKNGDFRKRVITEVGGFEPKGDSFAMSNTILGACSRALLRCMLRAFGYGLELYKDDEPEMNTAQAWQVLKDYAAKKKVKEADLIAAIKEAGITNDTLVDRFEDAYALVAELAKNNV